MARFLTQALQSVLDQVPTPSEVVVIDDQSTDDPHSIVATFGDRVRLIEGPGRGSAIARNIGILETHGEFVAFLDADDYWRPGLLAASLQALAQPQFGLSFTDWQHEVDGTTSEPQFGSYYQVVAEGSVFSALLRENWILTSSVVVRRSALAYSGLFDAALVGAQDYDLWLRLARSTQFACVRAPLAVKRGHGANITASAKYDYHLAKVWKGISARHTDVAREDALYIKQRRAAADYAAGLAAIREENPAIARAYLKSATTQTPLDPHRLLWLALAHLPAPILRRLIAWRRSLKTSDQLA